MSINRICLIEGCANRVFSRGWCCSHYKRWWRHGDPLLGTAQNNEPEKFIREIAAVFEGEECLIWPYGKSHGYGYVNSFEGRRGSKRVHQILCEIVHGISPSSKHEVAHNCGKGHLGCCNPKHLRWDTRKGNFADKIIHGTAPRGENNGHAKLTELDVKEIRSIFGIVPRTVIAAKFGVTESCIYSVTARHRWRHVA